MRIERRFTRRSTPSSCPPACRRRHTEFEVLLLRVLDLVVADAVQALDEHHHGRDARAGDFRRIVQRAGRQAVRDAAGFADRLVAEPMSVSWNGRGSICQRRSQVTSTLPSAAKRSLASLASASILASASRVEMALVERDPAFLDDAGDDAGLGRAGADGANAAAAVRRFRKSPEPSSPRRERRPCGGSSACCRNARPGRGT